MKSPRTAYRVTTIVVPVALTAALLAVLTGTWLFAISMGLAAFGCIANRREMRRRGIDWDGPVSYRELRERQAERRRAATASRPSKADPGRPGHAGGIEGA